MRSSNKSRSRNKNQNRRASTNIVNRVFDSSGPDGKVRGTPQQIVEKYQALARDAQLSGDRVAAEAFQQHAEHYLRLLADAMREQNQRREAHEAQQAQHAQRRDTQNNNSNSQTNTAQTSNGDNDANAPVQNDLRNSEQPDVVHAAPATQTPAPAENAEQPAGNGLVETPEDKPRRAPRRAPRKKPENSDQAAE